MRVGQKVCGQNGQERVVQACGVSAGKAKGTRGSVKAGGAVGGKGGNKNVKIKR